MHNEYTLDTHLDVRIFYTFELYRIFITASTTAAAHEMQSALRYLISQMYRIAAALRFQYIHDSVGATSAVSEPTVRVMEQARALFG